MYGTCMVHGTLFFQKMFQDQYIFIHDVISDMISTGDTALTSGELLSNTFDLTEQSQVYSNTDAGPLHSQFQVRFKKK